LSDHSPELDKLAAAMAAAQAEMPAAPADATNPHFKSRYADLASVWGACRGVLSKHGLSVVQCPGGDSQNCVLTTYLLHSSGQWIRTDAVTAVKEGPQPYGAALTYLRRYSLSAMVGVVSEEDDDGETAQRAAREQPKAANGGGGPISDAQRKRMFAIAKERAARLPGVSAEEIVRSLLAKRKLDSSKDVPRDLYGAFCEAVAEWEPPVKSAGADFAEALDREPGEDDEVIP
jgi:hypothetical protein